MRFLSIIALLALTPMLACSGDEEPSTGNKGGGAPIPKPTCAEGEINDPLAGHCVAPLGASLPCPSGSFLDAHQWLSSEERVLYVEAGALGGDGSAKKPLGSIAEALSGGDTSVVIMLAKGTHPAPEQIAGSERTIRLIGACPAETAITGPVKVNQGSIGLSALEIRAGLTVTEAKSVELHQLVITNPDGDGIAIDGSSLDKLDLWHSEVGETGRHGITSQNAVGWWTIDGADFQGPIGGDGISIVDFGGSQFKFRQSMIGQVAGSGLRAERALGWWTIDGADFQGPVGGDGISIVDFGGSQFDVVETAFREVAGDGINGQGAVGWWTIDGADFRGPIGGDGISIVDFGGSQFTVAGSEFSQVSGSGVVAFQGAGEWSISRNVLSGPIDEDGLRFMAFLAGSTLNVSENTIAQVGGAGLRLDGGEGNATLSGNQITGTGSLGMDIANVASGSTVQLSDNRIENATGVAIGLETSAAEMILSGNEIVGTGSGDVGGADETSAYGFGLTLLDVGNVTVHQNHVQNNRTAGVLVDLEFWGYYADRSDLVGTANIDINENECTGHHDPETLEETNVVIQNVDDGHNVTVDNDREVPNEPSLGAESSYAMKRGRDRRAQNCGDGVQQRWESCDDGNDVDDDGCSNRCETPTCGDGQVHGEEACDDGNNNPFDSCNNQCEAVYAQNLVVSDFHLCGLCGEGRVCCQGKNTNGQLGQGNREESVAPVRVPNLQHVVEVVSGAQHTCARTRIGRVACWGANAFGQVGNGSDDGSDRPSWVVTEGNQILSGAVRIFAGDHTTCAVKHNDSVFCWGDNRKAQISATADAPEYMTVGTQVVSIEGSVEIAIGAYHVCRLNQEGEVACWGDVDQGAIGSSPNPNHCPGVEQNYNYCIGTPIDVSFPGDATAHTVDSGTGFSCAVVGPERKVYCWGSNASDGRLGHGDPDRSSTPTAVESNNGDLTGILRLALGPAQACALRNNGTAMCWGNNDGGRLPIARNNRQPWVPQPLLRESNQPNETPPLEGINRLDLGMHSGCARSSSEPAGLYCFGKIYNGNEFERYDRATRLSFGDD